MSETEWKTTMYLSWCKAKYLDPDETASATAYEDCWSGEHSVPEHTCYGARDGYCDVCNP